nr:zinc finger protein 420-like [Lytechinus pictus]
MSMETTSRRSHRSDRKLPARYRDDSVAVSPTAQQRTRTFKQTGKLQGKQCVSTLQSVGNMSSVNTPENQIPSFKTEPDALQIEGSPLEGDGKITKEVLQCETSEHIFTKRNSLVRNFQAETCQRHLSAEAVMEEEDVNKEVQMLEALPPRKERKICNICEKSFVDKYTLLVHLRTHTGERPYHCTLCDMKFSQRSTLQFHMDTHSGKKHECSICGYKFTQARSLKRHMYFHTGNKEMKRKLVNQDLKKVYVTLEEPEKNMTELCDKNRLFVQMYECEFCNKHFKRVAELKVHLRVHTNERPYCCKICGKSFKQLCHLNGHQKTHDKSGSFPCLDCGSHFSQLENLQRHQANKICAEGKVLCRKRGRPRKFVNIEQKHDESKVVVTDETDVADNSSSQQGLENVQVHEYADDMKSPEDVKFVGSGPFVNREQQCANVCELCGKALGKNDQQHNCTNGNEESVFCDICNKKFRSLNFLNEHLKSHSQHKPYSCENCNKRFKTLRSQQNHAGRNCCTGRRPYQCETCGKSFMYSRYLKTHRCLDTPVKVYSCGDCGKMYRRQDRLIEHMRVHTGERPFVCTICDKTFAKIANFRLHQRVHTGEKKYECSHCKKRFAHNSTLRYHETTHKTEKAFQCDQCDKQFPRLNALQAHKQVCHVHEVTRNGYMCGNCGKVYQHLKRLMKHHCEATSGKRFVCKFCCKQFDREKQLDVHLRIHTGEKPYKCDKCGKGFSQSGGLTDHMVCHTREKKFQCDLCGAKFLRMKSLRKHKLIIHTGVEPQICKLCGATFKYYKALKKHEAIHETESRNFTDILEDIEHAINNASTTQVEPSNEGTVVHVVSDIDQIDQVAEVVVQEDGTCQEVIIADHPGDGHVFHLLHDPEQLEIEQSIQEIQIQAQLEQEVDMTHQVLTPDVTAVDYHEEVVSAS